MNTFARHCIYSALYAEVPNVFLNFGINNSNGNEVKTLFMTSEMIRMPVILRGYQVKHCLQLPVECAAVFFFFVCSVVLFN